MKKALTIHLLPVFIFSIIGWQWMFFLKLSTHEEKEWSRDGEGNNLEVVVISKANSSKTFLINDHELIHDGKLFDVKYKEKSGDNLVCYCERDGAEENLLSSFDLKTKDSFDNSFSANSKTQKVVKLSLFEIAGTQFLEKKISNPNKIVLIVQDVFHSSSSPDSFFVPPDVA